MKYHTTIIETVNRTLFTTIEASSEEEARGIALDGCTPDGDELTERLDPFGDEVVGRTVAEIWEVKPSA